MINKPTNSKICISNHGVLIMSDKKMIIGDEMIQKQLNENSKKLDISLNKLIERYIKRGVYSDDYYVQPKLTRDELDELSKKDLKRDLKMGIPLKKHDFSFFIDRWNK